MAAGGFGAELCLVAGVCAAALGDDAQAEQLWQQAIAIDPGAARAHFNLGRLYSSRKRYEEAERYCRQAIALDQNNPGAHCNLGILLARRKQHEEAEGCYRAAIALDPNDSAVHSNLGVLLATQGRDDEADRCYRQALALDPRNREAHSNLGALLAKRNHLDAAEECYRQAIDLDPRHGGAYCNLALLLIARGRLDEAEQCYRRAIELAPERAEAYTNLGLLLDEQERDEEAERLHRKALTLSPASAEIWSNLGNLLAKLQREEEAEQCYRQAIALSPAGPSAFANLGALLATRGREAQAEQCFRQAIALAPTHPLARVNLGYLLLGQGRLTEGWIHHEARYAVGLAKRATIPPELPFPQWQGEALTGRSLLLWPEQGFGDEIQLCRFVPLLKEQGASRITLVCKAPLKALMETLEGVDRVLAADPAWTEVGLHDYWTFPLSLPLHCKTELETIPARIPYLHASSERVALWSSRLRDRAFRVGIVWKGNEKNSNDAHRSLPSLSALKPLWSVAGVQFVSLQKGPAEDEARGPPPGQPLLDLGSDIADFADTAAIVQQLDLVICVDTAVAHLTGALGKPCWVLLPAYKTDWRWLQGRDDSPWYPRIMRLFRQGNARQWDSVIDDVTKALADHVRSALE